MRKTVLAGLILLGMALFVTTGISGGGKKVKGQLPPGWKKLDLGKDQIQKIYTIQTQYRDKIKAIEEQIKELRSQEKSEMLKVLSATQKDQLRKILLGDEKEKKPSTKSKDKD